MTYAEKLRDPKWQRKRLEIMKRDGFGCRDCGETTKTLHVHHCYYGKCEPWEVRSELLLTLCWECHEMRQEQEDDGKLMLGQLFARCMDIDRLVKSLATLASSGADPVELYSRSDMDWAHRCGFEHAKKKKCVKPIKAEALP